MNRHTPAQVAGPIIGAAILIAAILAAVGLAALAFRFAVGALLGITA